MQTLSYALGGCEYVLVAASLLWLIAACVVPSRRRARRAALLALFTAVTVAQPFGIVAEKQPAPPSGARPVETTAVHVDRLLGHVPILPFALYRQRLLMAGENSPQQALEARSWFWLPILTNATRIKSMCPQIINAPCWDPAGRDPALGSPSNLQLLEKDGRYYATLRNGVGLPPLTWELVPGVASIAGLGYWLLIAMLIPLAGWSSSRAKRRADEQAHTSA
jgi:hypothetical protein